MATRHPHTGQPSALSSMLEARVFFEIASLPYALPMLMQNRSGLRMSMHLYITPMEVTAGVPVRVGVIMSPLDPVQTDRDVAQAA